MIVSYQIPIQSLFPLFQQSFRPLIAFHTASHLMGIIGIE